MARTKVDRLRLLEKVEETVAREQAEYELALAFYEAELLDWQDDVFDVLDNAGHDLRLDQLSELYDTEYRRDDGYIKVRVPRRPEKPSKPRDESFNLNVLRLSTDATVSVDLDDFRRFLT